MANARQAAAVVIFINGGRLGSIYALQSLFVHHFSSVNERALYRWSFKCFMGLEIFWLLGICKALVTHLLI